MSALKQRLANDWAELFLLGPALLAAVIYQGGLLFWLGITLILLSTWILVRVMGSDRLAVPRDALTLSLLGWWLWMAATTLWSPAPMVSLSTALALLVLPLAYLGWFAGIASNEQRLPAVYALMVGLAALLAILALNEARLGIPYPRSLFINKNTHAGFLSPLLLITAGLFLTARTSAVRWLLGAAVLMIAVGAALPASRGALAGLLVGAVLLGAVAWDAGLRGRLLAGLALMAIGYLLGGLHTDLAGRVAMVADAQTGAAGRWYIWEGALRTLASTPWYGNGLGTFWLVYPPFQHPLDPSLGLNPHNDYLEILIDAGIPGLGLLLALALSVLWLGRGLLSRAGARATRRIEAASLLAAVVAVGIHGFFSHNLYHTAFALVIGLSLGRLQQLRGERRAAGVLPQGGRLALGAGMGLVLLLGAAMTLSSAMLVRAQEAREAGRLDAAAQMVSRIKAWLPSDDRASWLQARIALDRALAEPGASEARRAAAYARILRYLDEAETVNPLRPQTPLLRAEAKRRLGAVAGPEAALSDYARALSLDPRYVAARDQYAETLLRMGRLAEAHRLLVEGLKYRYVPSEAMRGYLELTGAVCDAVGDAHNGERARRALARLELELAHLRSRRPPWSLPGRPPLGEGSSDGSPAAPASSGTEGTPGVVDDQNAVRRDLR